MVASSRIKGTPMFRFTIRDVLWLTVVVGMGVGWWIDHWQISSFERELIDGWRQMAIKGESTYSPPHPK
jgi:hypothetical protein